MRHIIPPLLEKRSDECRMMTFLEQVDLHEYELYECKAVK